MIEAKLLHSKTYTKNVKFAKMVEFNKACDQNLCWRRYFFSNAIILSPLSPQEKYLQKTPFGRNGPFPSAWRIIIRTWRRVLLGDMNKNEQIQFFDSQMYLQ